MIVKMLEAIISAPTITTTGGAALAELQERVNLTKKIYADAASVQQDQRHHMKEFCEVFHK